MPGPYADSSSLYTMSSWYSTTKVSQENAPIETRLSQSLRLVRVLQAHLTEGQIAIPSTDSDTTKDRLEIVVWYKTIRRPRLPEVDTLLTQAAVDWKLTYRDFVEEDDQMTVSFTETEVNNIRRCFDKTRIPDGGLRKADGGLRKADGGLRSVDGGLRSVDGGILDVDGGILGAGVIEGICKAQQEGLKAVLRRRRTTESYSSGSADDPTINGVQTSVSSEPIWLSSAIIERLRTSRGDRLKSELSGISDAIREIAAATKTGWATFIMVAKGVVTVGSYVGNYVTGAVELESLEAISVCCSALGVAGVAVILASVISIITAVVILLKDCINILIVINNTASSAVVFTGDEIINGERASSTASLPKRPGAEFAHAAFYTYRKFHVGPQALGLFGSLFGATFRLDNRTNDEFSVAMDCPLTIFGGTNSIRVSAGKNAKATAWLAGECGNEEDQAVSDGMTVAARARRAMGLGNANWAYLCFEDNLTK